MARQKKSINIYDEKIKQIYLKTKIKFMQKENFKCSDQNILKELCLFYGEKNGN